MDNNTNSINDEEFLVLHEFFKSAKSKLSKETWDYLFGGAETETNEPIKCDSQNKRVSNEVFKGISAKQLGILITEERNDLITRFDHALYLGRELQKAEECLYKKLPYIQD